MQATFPRFFIGKGSQFLDTEPEIRRWDRLLNRGYLEEMGLDLAKKYVAARRSTILIPSMVVDAR